MRITYTANWGLQIAEMIFQTRSNFAWKFLTVFRGLHADCFIEKL
ncbi:DUF6783 domain-containing protein [Oliverpabstia intestinalis]